MADETKVNLEHLPELKRLTALANNGRGICCVKDVIMFLEKGMYNEAFWTCRGENDKITNYPEVQKVLYKIIPAYEEDYLHLKQVFGWK